jgi:hypothetical protein
MPPFCASFNAVFAANALLNARIRRTTLFFSPIIVKLLGACFRFLAVAGILPSHPYRTEIGIVLAHAL